MTVKCFAPYRQCVNYLSAVRQSSFDRDLTIVHNNANFYQHICIYKTDDFTFHFTFMDIYVKDLLLSLHFYCTKSSGVGNEGYGLFKGARIIPSTNYDPPPPIPPYTR